MKRSLKSFGLITAVVLVLASFEQAQSTTWIGTTGNWSTGTNWLNGEPGSGDNAYINNGGTAQITLSGEICYDLFLGLGPGESGTVSMSGGSLSTNEAYLGFDGTGTFTQTGGTHTSNAALHLGEDDTSNGTYELSDTGSLSAVYEYIGFAGTGTFTQTGGMNTAKYVFLGSSSPSNGTYNLSGTGSLSADN